MRFHVVGVGAVLLLAACTPAEDRYCDRMGTPQGNAEYSKCVRYYFEQTAMYRADMNGCAIEADQVYPRSLYDYGRTVRMHGGYGPYGYYPGRTFDIEPDYTRNAMVDQLRMQITGPCMVAKGWRDPFNWESGRGTPPKPVRSAPVMQAPLPWIK